MFAADQPLTQNSSSLLISFGRRRADPSRGDSLRTVLFHPSGGRLGQYLALVGHLSRRGPVHGVRGSGLHPGEEPHDDVHTMADLYAGLLADRPEPPTLLAGWSLGGLLAWEVAHRLAADGPRPAVVMVDSFADPWSACHTARDHLRRRILDALPDTTDAEERALAARTADAHLTASAVHRATPGSPGPVLLLACESEELPTQRDGWLRRDPALDVRSLPCTHFEVFDAARTPLLLRHLDDFLAAQAPADR
ncbi:thioesterase domain-containing protein [Streptomyces sp. MAA16]|uniref:thioesterase domain-containing protein n=1 Tax=Streptomyces sp. MAA16 TaxID=3035116 RepID=UPI002473C2E4|nr:thioesterase domain-containing protein [Streptomyces sp. MAA16]MDH6695675.1 thioesterase domain-containing protein [Streptomyces sp. MAA16]